MKKILFAGFLFINFMSFGQKKTPNNNRGTTKSDFWEHVRFGGGLGLSFGNNQTVISVSPTAVYDFNDKFSLGSSLGYTYSKNGDFRANIYSASILSIYAPHPSFEISGELEQLFVNQKIDNFSDNYTYPSLYLGLAYKTRNVAVGGRFDVLYDDDKSIYTSPFTPFVRVFF